MEPRMGDLGMLLINMALLTRLFYQYTFQNVFSGEVIYESWTLSFYNVFYTVLPPLALGILDQFISARLLDRYPQLYMMGQKNEFFRMKVFGEWLANAVYHPADYELLSRGIGEQRIGRAFSLHTFSGYLGGAMAPAMMLGLAAIGGLEAALWGAGLLAIGTAVPIGFGRDLPAAAPAGRPASGKAGGDTRVITGAVLAMTGISDSWQARGLTRQEVILPANT